MAYTVLARRYRSRDFDEVIGQEPIARTLQRAIETERIAHAFLFSGTRGVGKTSMARIFAKALNVSGELQDADAIAAAIMQGNDMDVIEIDGASNNRVEEARELIANCIYRPARCAYKIYIIDEVHMLSNAAFNALLKTMEEPPGHVKFILCTTEPHKVPATIQSRCQRFDFRAIPTPRIAEHLKTVLKQEKIKADDQVITQIARQGNGSMRDALSLLDRLLASGEKKLSVELLQEMLGLPDQAVVEGLVQAMADRQPSDALARAGELIDRGIALEQLIDVLIEHLRTLMLLVTCGPNDQLIDLTLEEQERLLEQAQQFDAPTLVHMIVLLENVQRAARQSATGRALFEAAVVRLALAEQFALISDVAAGRMPPAARSAPASTQKKTARPVVASQRKPGVEKPVPTVAPTPVHSKEKAASKSPELASKSSIPESMVTNLALDEAWPHVVREAHDLPGLGAVIDQLECVGTAADRITLRVRETNLRAFAESKREQLASMMSERAGRRVAIEFEKPGDDAAGGPSASPKDNRSNPALSNQLHDEAVKIPLVRQAMEILDARIIEVKKTDERSDS